MIIALLVVAQAAVPRAATSSTPTRSPCSSAPIVQFLLRAARPAATLGFRLHCQLRLARPARRAGAEADAAGDDRRSASSTSTSLINSTLGSLVSDQAPRAIDAAFRIYMLPQGMFSVALATVLFPTLARFAARGDLDRPAERRCAQRHAPDLPAADPRGRAHVVLATPITRLSTSAARSGRPRPTQVSEALFWFSLLAAAQRRQPAAHAHVLLAPAAVAADRARRRNVGGQRRACRSRSTSRSGIAGAGDRHGGRQRSG